MNEFLGRRLIAPDSFCSIRSAALAGKTCSRIFASFPELQRTAQTYTPQLVECDQMRIYQTLVDALPPVNGVETADTSLLPAIRKSRTPR